MERQGGPGRSEVLVCQVSDTLIGIGLHAQCDGMLPSRLNDKQAFGLTIAAVLLLLPLVAASALLASV